MAEELSDEAVEFANRMFDFARDGDARLLAYVDRGVDANLTTELGDTLLMLAAYNGRADLVAGLIERDVDVNAMNDRGQTPVAGAVFKAHGDIVDLLVEAGADLDAGSPSARETAAIFGRSLPGDA